MKPMSNVVSRGRIVAREDISGLVLAGGRGSRMGGVDKGLQPYAGVPLALHALRRLEPQVAAAMINANRHADRYAAFGVAVWADEPPEFAGPLAGFLAGLAHCRTAWLATVPCDSPRFPLDLVARLAAAVAEQDAEIALAATAEAGSIQLQPVFSLLRVELRTSLEQFVAAGQRKIDRWTATHRCAIVVFDDGDAFANANTAEELRRMQER